jgi:beta-galactosidase
MVDSIRFKPYLIGGSIWTWNDYRSSYVGTREFSENRPWGVVNVFRQKKKAYYSLRKEYAPIRGLSATLKNENKNVSINIAITPRTTLDLPAYNLKNYVLAWKGYDDKAKILDGGFKQLPLIKPGDKTSEEQVVLKRNASLSYIQLELISPLNYTVYDTTIFLKKPEPPKIVYAKGVRIQFDNRPANRGAMHIVFAGDGSSTMYKARYGKNSLTDETAPTRNHFINIQNLQHDEVYKVAVVGINNAGESEPSNVQELKIESGMQPPTIYYTEPADKGFFVGYATTNVDYLYQLQYTTVQGNYSNAQMVQSSTKGVLFVPNLINGQQYYFRMKAIKHNNFHSDWSEEYSIVPDGNQLPQQPILEGVLVNNTTALISFKPVKKAIGYVIYHRSAGNGEWKKTQVSSAQTGNFLITGLNRKKVYEFKMSSKNEQGESKVTDIIRTKAF